MTRAALRASIEAFAATDAAVWHCEGGFARYPRLMTMLEISSARQAGLLQGAMQ
jgi:hypothetical protein